jgi:hypothetical protein
MTEAEKEREAEVAVLVLRAQDPDDEYDGHHGTDRSAASLAFAKKTDPETAARVARKMAEGK